MQELPKVNDNYNHDLPKVSHMILTVNFNLPNVSKIIKSLAQVSKSN